MRIPNRRTKNIQLMVPYATGFENISLLGLIYPTASSQGKG